MKGSWVGLSYTFFCKNRLYKNNEVETGQKIRTNLEHFVVKDKKNKNDEQTRYKRMTWMPSKLLKHYKKNIKKVKVKELSQKHYKIGMYYPRAIMKLIQFFLCKRQDA